MMFHHDGAVSVFSPADRSNAVASAVAELTAYLASYRPDHDAVCADLLQDILNDLELSADCSLVVPLATQSVRVVVESDTAIEAAHRSARRWLLTSAGLAVLFVMLATLMVLHLAGEPVNGC